MNPVETETLGRATYSPEDNKLRFYPFARLSPENYARMKAHGFSWAPKQELFVAPAWSPDREDFLESVAGTIEDEDKSLVQRAEGRLRETESKAGFWLTPGNSPAPEAASTPSAPAAAPSLSPSPDADFRAMKDTIKAGISAVAAPQLFPTPPEIAKRMTERALFPGRRILEPSAGTGNLVRAALNAATGADCCRIVAVEISPPLAEGLRQMRDRQLYANEDNFQVVQGDFLEQNGNLGTFDLVLMNPPFQNGADIRHIQHARKFLKRGGKIIALCANGPRQAEELKPLASYWEDLPDGSFAEQGTNVRVALLEIDSPVSP